MRRVTLAVSFLLLFMAAHTTIAAQNAAAANGISAVGAVFVMTNDVTQNDYLVLSRRRRDTAANAEVRDRWSGERWRHRSSRVTGFTDTESGSGFPVRR
jgi:hypothetical protein